MLKLSRNLLLELTKKAAIGFFEFSPKTGALKVDATCAENLGYAKEELTHMATWEKLIHPDRIDNVLCAQKDFLNGGGSSLTLKYPLRCKGGAYKRLRVTLSKHSAETVVGCSVFMPQEPEVDNEALRTSMQLSSLFNAMEDVVLELDYNGTYISVAPTRIKYTLKPSEEVLGKTIHELDVFPEEQADDFLRFVRRCIDENKSDKITYPLSFEGETIWFEGRGTPMANGRLLYIATDITERKRAEQELINSEARLLEAKHKAEHSEQRLKIAIKSAQLGIWDWNLADNELIWDDKTYELLGIRKDTKEDRFDLWQNSLHPDDKDRVRKELEEVIRCKAEYSTTFRMVDTNRKTRYMDAYCVVIRDKDDRAARVIGVVRDVTSKKSKEIEKLREAKNKAAQIAIELKEVQKMAKLGSWYLDLTTNKVTWSDETYRIYGYKPGTSVPDFPEFEKLSTPESWAILNQTLQEAIEVGLPYELEHEFLQKNGKAGWMWAKAKCIFDSNNKVIGVRGTSLDITERKKLEIALTHAKEKAEKSEQRLRVATSSAQLGIWDWDIKEDTLIWNDRMYEIYGRHKGSILRKNFELWTEGLHPEDKERAKMELYDALNGKKNFDTSFRVVHPDGEVLYIKAQGIVLKDSQNIPYRMVGVNRDVTDEKIAGIQLKQAKERAEESEQRLKVATHAAQLGVWDWDISTGEITWDDKSFELHGLKKGIDTPSFVAWCKSVHPDDLDSTLIELEDALEGKKMYNATFRIILPDGTIRYINGSGIVFKNAEGNPYRMVGVNRDVTDEKIGELQLKDAKEKAEAASVAKSAFLANMSHEIRTPLNSIIGFSELLMQTSLDETQSNYLKSISYSGETLLSLINDILDFSKIEAGKLQLEEKQTNLHELLLQVVEMVKFRLNEKEIELLLYIAPGVPQYVVTDAVRLRQVLVNLMDNAIKFTEAGEVELSVVPIAQAEKAPLRFGVRDTGIGISSAQQERIFEAFLQEDTSTTRKYGGTGLGLSISNQILSLMSSTLKLESQQGKGSFFYFEADFGNTQPQPTERITLTGIKSILLVDDNVRSLEIIQGMFAESHIKVDTATNGYESLVKLQANYKNYDAVLLDYKMPLLSGEEVVKKLREIAPGGTQPLPIYMMFDFVNKEACRALKEKYTVTGCLPKPFTKEKVFHSIELFKDKNESYFMEKVAAAPQAAALTLAGKSLLVVDDNALNRKLASSMLSTIFQGIQVLEAESGEHALALVKKHDFELILMDVQMPGMSGYETTKTIRQIISGTEDTVIIALTAGVTSGEKERCIAAGMNDYMSKPITLNRLKAILQKWVRSGTTSKNKVSCNQLGEEHKVDFRYSKFLHEIALNEETAEKVLSLIRGGDLKKEIQILNETFKQEEKPEGIRSLAHKIKGVATNLCFENLAYEAGLLEDIYPNYATPEAAVLLEKVNKAYQFVEKIIFDKEYLKRV